jgi:putative ABC transport system permease protein
MRFVKHALLSLWHERRLNLLLLALVTALLYLLFVVAILNASSDQQLRELDEYVGSAVTAQKINLTERQPNRFRADELEALLDSPLARGYNAMGADAGSLVGLTPYIADRERYDRAAAKDGGYLDDCFLVGVTDSRAFSLFSGAGYRLRQGRHITAGQRDEHVALVSGVLAKANSLRLGDRIEVTASEFLHGDSAPSVQLAIQGIFDYPQESYLEGAWPEDHPANFIFIPGEALNALSPVYAPTRLTVYLDGAGSIAEYVGEAEGRLGAMAASYKEAIEFEFTWDKTWLGTVSRPAADMNALTGMMAAIMGIGAFAVAMFVFAIALRRKRRAIGIMLALGERGAKAALLAVSEGAAVVLLAACAAFALGMMTAPTLSRAMMEGAAGDANYQIAGERDDANRNAYIGIFNLNHDMQSVNSAVPIYRAVGELEPLRAARASAGYAAAAAALLLLSLYAQALWLARKMPAGVLNASS